MVQWDCPPAPRSLSTATIMIRPLLPPRSFWRRTEQVSLGEFRDAIETSRNMRWPSLEYWDRKGITKRWATPGC